MRYLLAALALYGFSLLLVLPTVALAEDESESSQAYASMAVQNRLFTQTGEISAFVGLLPMDAFTKGLTLSGAYTHHFSDLWAWEAVHYFYSFHIGTGLRDDLKAFDLGPTPFEVVDQMLTSNAVFTPIYWKGAVGNRSLIHGEFFLLLGAGYAWFTHSNRPAIDLGLGIRVYASRLFSFRVDVRHHTFFNDKIYEFNLNHELWTGAGTSLSF
jgi:outer membrane beta-barrel protein